MSDEQPVTFKKRKVCSEQKFDESQICIVHYIRNTTDLQIRPLTENSFRSIQQAANVRQRQSTESLRLDHICQNLPETFDSTMHGIHRWCYSNFTNVSKLSTKPVTVSPTEYVKDTADLRTGRRYARSTKATGATGTVLFPREECIFCSKGRKKLKGSFESLSTCVTETAQQAIKKAAQEKEDFLLLGKIEGIDLRAREARYHESCRRSYIKYTNRHQGPSASQPASAEASKSWHKEQRDAHSRAFQYLCDYVQQSVIDDSNVERMTMLRDRYLEYMTQHSPEHYNENYRTAKLKDRLQRHFGEKINFWLPSKKHTSELVYAADLDTGEAVEVAFEASASEKKILSEAASILRKHIQCTHNTGAHIPWPPSTSYLQHEATKPPKSLLDFLALVVSGKQSDQSARRTQRLCGSFAEDICSAATRGQWTVPKHLLLGLTLHHLTGKADVVTLLHRYGHCASYTGVLELETAMATQVQQQDSVLPSNIATTGNKVAHLCWDNFDLNEETPSGAGTTHTTHGIVIQEVDCENNSVTPSVSVAKSKKRSLEVAPITPLPPVSCKNSEPCAHVSTSAESAYTAQISNTLQIEATEQLWSICRGKFNTKYTVPDWNGWLSKTSTGCESSKDRLSRVGYMTPILHPITEFATVKKCLDLSKEVSEKVQQEYTLVTMDLAAARIAYDIMWSSGDLYEKVLLNIGPFHTMCSYMGALGKMMCGSGFEDIIIEAGLCASGSIEQVMSGRHYNRAMRIHQRILEALERMLQMSMDGETELEGRDECASVTRLADEPCAANLEVAAVSGSSQQYFTALEKYKQRIREGSFGKTAQFWMSYCDCVWLLLRFQRAVKENKLDLFITTLKEMSSLLFSADHLHYARYLPVYYMQLNNVATLQPGLEVLLQECGFSVARSTVPACRIPVDQTIEQTVNRSAKTAGGIIGFSRKPGAYHRWCLTRHKRAEYVEKTLEEADMLDSHVSSHKSTRTSAIRRSELEVRHVLDTFDHFMNPFTVSQEQQSQLFCLSSGQPASATVAEDLSQYVAAGEKAAAEFIQTRLIDRSAKFHDKMKKLSLSTFHAMAAKCVVSSTKKKAVEVKAERNLLGSLLMLSQRHDISLERLFDYPLGPIPWALATADGSLVKTNKAQLMHCIEDLIEQPDIPQSEACVHVIDGNALLQSLARLPETFEGLAMCVFRSLPKVETTHFVTDTYIKDSIKQLERSRRGSSPTYLLGGSKTRLPRDFKAFMLNEDNKRQLISFLLAEWQTQRYAPLLQGRKVFFVCETQCICLHSADGTTVSATCAQELCSNQEEADTRIVLHCLYAAERVGSEVEIVIRSPDTDVFILLLYYSFQIQQRLLFDTGFGNHRRMLDVHVLAHEVGQDVCEALPAFHAFTGCDTTSAFVRKGKKGPFKLMCKSPPAIDAFRTIGTSCNIPDITFNALEHFVCAMYGKPLLSQVNKVRYEIFKSRYELKPQHQSLLLATHNGIDSSLLPPCQTSLHKHCLRVNYQSIIWRNAHEAESPLLSPVLCGWKRSPTGDLTVDWTEESLPQTLIDIVAERETTATECEPQLEEVEEDELDNILDIVFEDEYADED